MTNVQAFPIYSCVEVSGYSQDEFEQVCTASDIRYNCIGHRNGFSVFVSEIQNEKQFQKIFPFYITLGSGNDLVVWSSRKDVFSLEKREWTGGSSRKTVVVNMEEDTSIFWIGYDGDFIATISNQPQFSTYETIIQTLPEFVTAAIREYAETDDE